MSNDNTEFCTCGERLPDNWTEKLENDREFEDEDLPGFSERVETIDEDELVAALEGFDPEEGWAQ